MTEAYRVVEDGEWFKERIYSKLSSARNAASQVWDYRGSKPSIQKLEPIFEFVRDGVGFRISVGWVNFE